MKKYIYVSLALIALAGCGSSTSNTNESSQAEPTKTRSLVKTSESTTLSTSSAVSQTESSSSQSKKNIRSQIAENYIQENEINQNGVAATDSYTNWNTLKIASTDPDCKEIAEYVAESSVHYATMGVGIEGPFEISVYAADNAETPVCVMTGSLHNFEPSETTSTTFPLFGE